MLIDIHGHIRSLPERGSACRALAAYLDRCEVNHLAVSNLDAFAAEANLDEVDANVACLEACAADPRLLAFYAVRAGRPDSQPQAMAGALLTEPFAGVVFAPALDRYEIDSSLLDRYLPFVSRARKPALVLCGRETGAHPSRVYRLARRHPGVPFVLCGTAQTGGWREAVETVRAARDVGDAQLLLATAGATPADVCGAVRTLGAERVVYGSDAACLAEAHGERLARWLAELRTALSAEAYESVSAGNARRIMPLDGLRREQAQGMLGA